MGIYEYVFFNDKANAAVEEYRPPFPQRRISDRRVLCTVRRQLHKKGSFPSVSSSGERPVRQNVEEEENIIEMSQRSPHVSTR
jgi:hypothetical protein